MPIGFHTDDCPPTLRSPDSQDRIEEDRRQGLLNKIVDACAHESKSIRHDGTVYYCGRCGETTE